MTQSVFKIATRSSALAMAQAKLLGQALLDAAVIDAYELLPTVSSLDQRIERSMRELPAELSFTKAVDDLVLKGQADLACHSAKDVGIYQQRLSFAYCLSRGSCQDCWLGPSTPGTLVGTDSPRRQALIEQHYPHCRVQSIRGNMQRRLQLWQTGEVDALIVAHCAIERLALDYAAELLAVRSFVPAMNQGIILGLMHEEHPLFAKVRAKAHAATWQAMQKERQLAYMLEVSCHDPIGIYYAQGRLEYYNGHIRRYASYQEGKDWQVWLKEVQSWQV